MTHLSESVSNFAAHRAWIKRDPAARSARRRGAGTFVRSVRARTGRPAGVALRRGAPPYVYVGNNPVNFVDPSGLVTFYFGGGASFSSSIVSMALTAFGFDTPTMLGGSIGKFVDISFDGIRVGEYQTTEFGLGAAGPFFNAGFGPEGGISRTYDQFVGNSVEQKLETGRTGVGVDQGGVSVEIGLAGAPDLFAGLAFTRTTAQGWKLDRHGLSYFSD